MNRHNGYQQPEATANDANADQWQIDLPEQDTGKVGNDSDAGGVNGGKDANDTNHTSDQGETVEVRVIKGDRDEPNDRPGQVEQGGQDNQTAQADAEMPHSTNVDPGEWSSQTVRTGAGVQPTGIETVKQIDSESALDVAVDAIESSARERQVERQLGLISEIMDDQEASKRDKHIRLDQLVENDEINLRDGKVLDQYLRQSMNTIDGVISDNKALMKSLGIINSDKVDLSDSELARVYIDACADGHVDMDDFQVGDWYIYYSVEHKKFASSDQQTISYCLDHIKTDILKEYEFDVLEESGIPLEQIVANKHIQDVAIEMMDDAVANVVQDGNKYDAYKFDTLSSHVPVDILSQICSSEDGKKRVVESIQKTGMSVQEFGEVLIDDNVVGSFKKGCWSGGLSSWGSKVAKCVNLMRNLGWHTAIGENDESLDQITESSGSGSDDQVTEMQSEAYKWGALDSKTVDRMYLREYSRLYDGINSDDRHTRLERSVISPDLVPSGDNPTVNYWHEQSKRYGADIMHLCMERILDTAKQGDSLDIAELVNEKGIVQDKFFQNYPGSLLWNVCTTKQRGYDDYMLRSLELLEAHQDRASEIDGSKAMIKLLSKMRDKDGKYDTEAVRLFRKSMGSICINDPGELFDGDELADKFYSAVFMRCYCNKDTDKFMSYIDSNWKDHYGDTGRKYLELISTYPDEDNYEQKRQWVEEYLGAGGPVNELANGILCDAYYELRGIPAEKMPDEWQKLRNFCGTYSYSMSRLNVVGGATKMENILIGDLAEYFDANGPTDKLVDKVLFNDIKLIYDHPELQADLSDDKKSLVKFCGEYSLDNGYMRKYGLTPDSLAEYFDANGPTDKLVDKVLFNDIKLIYDHPELQADLSDDKKSLVKFCGEYSLDRWWIGIYGLTADNLADYFDSSGPTNKMKDEILFRNVSFLYDHPELQTGLPDNKKNLIKFCGDYRADNNNIKKWGLSPDNLPDYVNDYGLTSKLIDQILLSDIDFLQKNPDLRARLSDDEEALLKFRERYGIDDDEIKKYQLAPDNLTDYFDANGPKSKFWQDTFLSDTHNLDLIYKYYQNQDEAGRERMGLDDKQIAVARGYSSIGEGNDWNNPRRIFESYVKDYYDELTINQIGWVADITARLANSNASELAERSEAFTRELLKLDSDKIPEALDKIEDIYIHNHLPYVGKNYLVFRTMHPSDNLEDDFDFDNGLISPVLQQATGDIRSGKLDQMLNSRDAIIVSDLLRASFGSNNRSIREYLATLKDGQTLLDQLSSGELAWDTFNQPANLMDKDTKANYDTLSTFAWHLATIYNSTLPGKEHPYQLIHQQSGIEELSTQPNALQTDFTNLTSLIKPNGRYSLADRSVRYFAHFVGIEDLAGAERYMDNVVKEADARNRKTAEYLTTTGEPKLQPGDLVKGMGGTDGYGIRYLSYAFQNGSISKEYLGDASRSDTTPLDADASIVPDQLNGEQTINQIMGNRDDRRMLAEAYGSGLWVVLRPDKDRFIITRRDKEESDQSVYDLSVPDANFDRTDLTQEEIDRRLKEIAEAKRHRREGLPKLEIFATGVDGDGHYGVRTGFGMDKVSYYISDRTTRTGKSLGWFNGNKGEEYPSSPKLPSWKLSLTASISR